MNTWANELLMSSRPFSLSVLPLKEAGRQRCSLVMYRGGGHLRDILSSHSLTADAHIDVVSGKYQYAVK